MDERELEGGFQNQIAFIVKSFFFALIGFMLAPPWPLIVFGVGIGVVLIVARAPAVYLATLFGKMGRGGRGLAVVSLPCGMAAGALATLPLAVGAPGTEGLQAIVFACIAMTILLFAIGFPIAKSRMEQIPSDYVVGATDGLESDASAVDREESSQTG